MSLQHRLEEIVGADHVLGRNRIANLDPGADEENLGADLYVRPADAAEAAAVLKLCTETGTPCVTHGGRTGLAGAARSRAGEIVLSTERMNRIVEIDTAARIAVVETGVTLQALQEAVAEHGLTPAIDIAARGSATIGGMIGTNAGGMEAFRCGMMRDRLLGLEVALPNGEVLSDLTRVKKANEGYDLKQIFCGAEGTLGVVSRAVIRLDRMPHVGQTVITAMADATSALKVMNALMDRGMLLRAEAMWKSYAHLSAAAQGLMRLVTFHDAPLYVIYETSAGEDETLEALAPFLEDGTILDALAAQSERERDDIWLIREDSRTAMREYGPRLSFDISLPLSEIDGYMAGFEARVAAIPGVKQLALGHLADGNLHLSLGAAAFDPALKQAAQLAVEEGIKAVGGAVSAEHGIGEDKRATLGRAVPAATLAAMRALKAAFDPRGVMNPGKVVGVVG